MNTLARALALALVPALVPSPAGAAPAPAMAAAAPPPPPTPVGSAWGEALPWADRPVSRAEADCAVGCAPAVFIVATGRSGSTTVMEMLNALPGYEVMGENFGLWQQIYEAHTALEEFKAEKQNKPVRDDVRNPLLLGNSFRGISLPTDEAGVMCALRILLYSYINRPQHAEKLRVWGFKEIRWYFSSGLPDARLLARVVPCAKFILSYREDIEKQTHSGMWGSREHAGVEERLSTARTAMEGLAADLPGRVFRLPLESFSLEKYNQLLAFLGEAPNCTYKQIVHANKGGKPGSSSYRPSRAEASDVIDCGGAHFGLGL